MEIRGLGIIIFQPFGGFGARGKEARPGSTLCDPVRGQEDTEGLMGTRISLVKVPQISYRAGRLGKY